MTAITIPLPEAQLQRLQELAREANLTPEELVRAALEEWLRQPKEDFIRAANYVLQKNAELYRRLA
jgi:predicted transcriptional regulator